jgi:hypothetical protein
LIGRDKSAFRIPKILQVFNNSFRADATRCSGLQEDS